MFKNHNIYIIGRILMKFYSQVELTMLTILHITIIIYISLSFTDIYLQNVKKKHTKNWEMRYFAIAARNGSSMVDKQNKTDKQNFR